MRVPVLYRVFDTTTGVLVVGLTLFLAWGFGINGLPWALWTVRALGGALGLLYLGKWAVGRATGYVPRRHGSPDGHWPIRMLAILNGLILVWVLISWLNPRADASFGVSEGIQGYLYGFSVLHYREDYLPWLPHSYDLTATRSGFLTYVGLTGAFWAARDWFLGFSAAERYQSETLRHGELPDRVRTWLWVVILSALMMAVVGVLQKLDGSRSLLWLIPWPRRTLPEMPFGPFLYRANAGQYFNLVWPLALGFWWSQRQTALALDPLAPLGKDASFVLLPITGILAACPAISLSRGATLVSAILLVASGAVFMAGKRNLRRGASWTLLGVLVGALALIAAVNGRDLLQRFARDDYGTLNGRTALFSAGRQMLGDFGWLGSGAETIPAIYHLYRKTPQLEEASEGYLHNDWLETLVTFGLGGGLLVLLCLPMLALVWRSGGGHPVSRVFGAQLAIGLGGMLLHAWFDFPFQVVALLGSWLIAAALLSSLAPLQGSAARSTPGR